MANSNTQLQAVSDELIVGNFTQKHLDIIKSTIAKGTSNEQLQLFIQTCVRTGLDPFLNQIYCIVYNGKDGPVMSMQIAVEGIVALAKKHPQYKGFIASEVKEADEFEIDMVTGEPKHRIVSMTRGQTVGAYCVAYREGAPNIAVIITRDQVEHLLKGRNSQMWKDYFDDMIVKHAIKRAFKRQYGIEVSEDEFGTAGPSADTVQPYDRKDVTPEPEPTKPDQPEPDAAKPTQTDKLRAEMKLKYKKLGITSKEAIAAHMQQYCTMKGDTPTDAELKAYLKILDMQIQEKQAAEQAEDTLPE